MRFVRGLTTPLVVAVGLSSLAALALRSEGYATQRLDLNDSGVWVTNDRDGGFGRLNRSAGSLDALISPPGSAQTAYRLDVLQDKGMVLARDVAGGRLFPVDAQAGLGVADQAVSVAPDDLVDARGGTVAVLDPQSGKVWAARYSVDERLPQLGALAATTNPVATVGPQLAAAKQGAATAALAVAEDGAIQVTAANGKQASIPVSGSGFGEPIYRSVSAMTGGVQTTVVGSSTVVLDLASGQLALPDGSTASLPQPDPEARLQQPGPTDTNVYVSTSKALYAVPMSGGSPSVVFAAGTGAPAAPVRLGGCTVGVWAGSPAAVIQTCDGSAARPVPLDRQSALSRPVLRVNRGAIVVNDTADGRVFDVELRKSLDNWKEIAPKQSPDRNDTKKQSQTPQAIANKKPVARPDDLGARPGRTTLLHVLDNDTDPAGRILVIASVTKPDSPGTTADISPDGQTVRLTMPVGAKDTSFSYTIDNGTGASAQANVHVTSRPATENKPPSLRRDVPAKAWTVPSGGSMTLPVLDAWRDYDGDPIAVVSARVNAGQATVNTEGKIEFTAPDVQQGAVERITYDVSDGMGKPVSEKTPVTVQAKLASIGVKPITEPDVARGEVGRPILVSPLANDLPGSDPSNPRARLALAGDIPSKAGIAVQTDLKSGQVSLLAAQKGAYFFDYTAAYGAAPFGTGKIRVDVALPQATKRSPVAMPDQGTIRGQSAALSDVLANDFDPAGSVLTVQAAEAANPDQLQVAVLKGRWVRVVPTTDRLSPNPQVVHYSVTNGDTPPVSGDLLVTQLPAVAPDPPITRDDQAVVREGDSVLVPVLANDTTEGGSSLSLLGNVKDGAIAGQLNILDPNEPAGKKVDDVGYAYVVGDQVRYVAPLKVKAPRSLIIEYVAQTGGGERAKGSLAVTVMPQPASVADDQNPTPAPLEARAVAGDTISIPVPSSLQDPDGDSVSVVAVSGATRFGRVKGFSPTGITYEAYPVGAGTESFSYVVQDRYGKQSASFVRIAVVSPGEPQPPVAMDDELTVAPGAHVTIRPMANDLYAAGDPVTVVPLDKTNAKLPDGVAFDAKSKALTATAPTDPDTPLLISYALTGNGGQSDPATVQVDVQEGFNNPPRVSDVVATPDGKATVDVDLLAQTYDPDGPQQQLKVTKVGDFATGPALPVVNGKVAVPVLDHAQAIPFEVTDSGGATSAAVIFVPAAGTGAPYVKTGSLITIDADSAKTVNLAEFVASPTGKPVTLTTTDKIWGSPSGYVDAAAAAKDKLTVTGKQHYVGPGAVTVEVTDGALDDPKALKAILTIPVQVGPVTPVLRCPTIQLDLVQGSVARSMDITSLCHVWTADPAWAAKLTYTADWKTPVKDVSISGSGSRRISLQAAGTAPAGSAGQVSIGIAGTQAVPAVVNVKVIAAAKPRLTSMSLTGVKQGTTAPPLDVSSHLTSPLLDKAPTVVSVTHASGAAGSAEFSGSVIRVTPAADAHGLMTFRVVASDVADVTHTDRQVSGVLTVDVFGVPDAPSAPQAGATVLSHAVTLSWRTGAANGAPIDSFEVTGGGITQTCSASPCNITGLTNGQKVTFTVRAHNRAGWSQWSAASAPVLADTKPPAVTGFKASQPADHTLQLSWAAVVPDGTPVTEYRITWTGGGHLTVAGGQTTAAATGLANNNKYTFTIVAVNQQGPGPVASTSGQSSGMPSAAQPAAKSVGAADADATAVAVTWGAVDANGPRPVTYTVTRNGGKVICRDVAGTSCTDAGVGYDGTTYTYTVTATNATGGPAHSSTSPAASYTAVGRPSAWEPWTLSGTGVSGQWRMDFTVPYPRGAQARIGVGLNNGKAIFGMVPASYTPPIIWRYADNGWKGGERVSKTGSFSHDTCVLFSVTAENESGAFSSGGQKTVCTYGPLQDPVISGVSVSGTNVSFTYAVDTKGRVGVWPTLTVRTSHGLFKTMNISGTQQETLSEDVGYSFSDVITVTISDPVRGTRQATVTAPRTPDPPPPPPSVTAFKGAQHNLSGCNSSACSWVGVTTANFPGPVTCRITDDSIHDLAGFISWTMPANGSQPGPNVYGFSPGWVDVTCGGITSRVGW